MVNASRAERGPSGAHGLRRACHHSDSPLRFVVLVGLNKYAPREGSSTVKELLMGTAKRAGAWG